MATAIDHVSQNAARLLWQLRNKPAFKGLVQSIGAEMNELETAFAELRDLRLATEVGAQLDQDGALVGVARNGRSDTDYRSAIRAQIQINRGNSRPEDILFAFEAALAGGGFTLSEPAPASVRIEIAAATPAASGNNFAHLLDALVGAGIAHGVIYSEHDAATTFTLAAGDAVQTSTAQGLANDGQTTGGYLAEAAQ